MDEEERYEERMQNVMTVLHRWFKALKGIYEEKKTIPPPVLVTLKDDGTEGVIMVLDFKTAEEKEVILGRIRGIIKSVPIDAFVLSAFQTGMICEGDNAPIGADFLASCLYRREGDTVSISQTYVKVEGDLVWDAPRVSSGGDSFMPLPKDLFFSEDQ